MTCCNGARATPRGPTMGRDGPRGPPGGRHTYEHHESAVRGLQRPERNMLCTVTGDFAKLDRKTMRTLEMALG